MKTGRGALWSAAILAALVSPLLYFLPSLVLLFLLLSSFVVFV
jgi:hypothetical protein